MICHFLGLGNMPMTENSMKTLIQLLQLLLCSQSSPVSCNVLKHAAHVQPPCTDDNPGPNHYHINNSNRSDIPTIPSYSMGQKLSKGKNKDEGPAPCDYQANTSHVKPSTPSYSMTPRRKDYNSKLMKYHCS